MNENTITRRAVLLGAAAVALPGIVACGAADDGASGPRNEEAPVEWQGSYLPIGSTVRLVGMPEGFEHVVVARRCTHAISGDVRDYALVQAVLGITSDLSGSSGLYEGELVLADGSDIAEVVQAGPVTEEELWAEQLLSEGAGTDGKAVDLLLPLIKSRSEKLGRFRDGS